MNINEAIIASSSAEEAKALLEAESAILGEWWIQDTYDYNFVRCASLNELIDSTGADPDCKFHAWLSYYGFWKRIIRQLSWLPQIKEEMRLIDEGHIPETVGAQPWLLIYAIYKERCDLIDKLIEQRVVVHPVAYNMLCGSDIIPNVASQLLNITTITTSYLKYLSSDSLISYSLPFLGEFKDSLAKYCGAENLMVLHDYGLNIDHPEAMIDALKTYSCNEQCKVLMQTIQNHITATPEIIRVAKKSPWYWVLYTTPEEWEALLTKAPSWRRTLEDLKECRVLEFNGVVVSEAMSIPMGLLTRIICHHGMKRRLLELPWEQSDREKLEKHCW